MGARSASELSTPAKKNTIIVANRMGYLGRTRIAANPPPSVPMPNADAMNPKRGACYMFACDRRTDQTKHALGIGRITGRNVLG